LSSVASTPHRALGRGRVALLLSSVLFTAAPVFAADAESGPSRADQPVTTSPDRAHPVTIVEGVTVIGQRPVNERGPGVSRTGANAYTVTGADISDMPLGTATPLSDVLTQMPGVAIDQNQQIHIRNTEGPQFQYQINGVLVPFDINTNPPFLTMINPIFIKQLDLLDGVLPSRYSYATGGVVAIQTKDGCEQPGGSVSILVGQREAVQPSIQYGGCSGKFSYYLNAQYAQGETAFSSATPGPNPIHDYTNQGQAFGDFAYQLDSQTKLSLVLSTSDSDNQLPNVPGLPQVFTLTGVDTYPSANINSHLNFRDYLGILSLNGSNGNFTYQLAFAHHYISQDFIPDVPGELIYQGVASRASHFDQDNTLEGDIGFRTGAHTLGAGIYAGLYDVTVNTSSQVFPATPDGEQTSSTPITIVNDSGATNVVLGLYVNDLWQLTDTLRANVGLRVDTLTGFTNHSQIDPTINLIYEPGRFTTIHAGFARYMQIPSFQGISPTTPMAFENTTAAGPPGNPTPNTENDYEWDIGAVFRLGRHFTFSQDNFYEITDRYLDTGQFSDVPIFAPFNYGGGYIWGSEFALTYRGGPVAAYLNLTLGQNWQKGVTTGQFNFDPDELIFIDTHSIPLDHQPLVGISSGVTVNVRPYLLSVDLTYSSGLVGGFADQEQLPQVVQVNAAVERSFHVPGIGKIVNRIAILNLLDRTNLIRPSEGIGIFQSAYGPRFTVLDSLTLPF
jgi:hypothetical protein